MGEESGVKKREKGGERFLESGGEGVSEKEGFEFVAIV